MSFGYLLLGIVVGVFSGFVGIGGGILIIPALVYIFHMDQHRAQGTTLVALVPPTGLLAFLNYSKAGMVSWKIGLLLIPGIFLGGIAGSKFAERLKPRRMRQVFAVGLFILGLWQVIFALEK